MNRYDRVGEQLWVMQVSKDGKALKLSDGTHWQVHAGDTTKTISWYPTQHVLVEESGDPEYPYTLRNLDTAADIAKVAPA